MGKKQGTLYKATYAWTDDGSGVRCAWCGKKESEIKDPVKHIDDHIRKDKEAEK